MASAGSKDICLTMLKKLIASQLEKAIAEGDAGKGMQLVEAAATRLAQAITSGEACMKEHAAKF